MNRASALSGAFFMLAGCAEISQPKPDISYNLQAFPSEDASARAVADYARSSGRFAKDVSIQVKYDDLQFDGAILLSAMAAVGGIVFGAPEIRPDILAGSGLYAGGVSAWKSRLAPKVAFEAYASASTRYYCLAEKLTKLDSVQSRKIGNDAFPEVLEKRLAALEVELKNVRESFADATDVNVRRTATDAINSATALKAIVANLQDSLRNGPRNGLSTIVQVSMDLEKSLVGGTLDYSTVRDSILASVKTAQQNSTNEVAAGSAPIVKAPVGLTSPDSNETLTIVTAALSDEIIQLKALTDSATPVQNLEADLKACRAGVS